MIESIVESSTEAVLNVARTERIRVLHVDDDQAFLSIAKQCLKMQGEIDVDSVSSVNEASEKLKKTDYDAIVCDYQMPGKDGLEFLKELRENGNTIPFIVFTGKGREEVAIKALNLGADQYIAKHGDPETVYCELAHSIRVAVERKKSEEALFAERDRLETVTRNIGAGLAIISKDYHTLWANDVLKQIFGDVEGKICYSTYNQRNDICPECGVQEIFETEKTKVVHEQVGKDADGKTIWSEITATSVKDRDGNITAVLELVVPITQRKRTEDELRDSEEKYRKLFDEALDAIFVADAETGILIDCNRAASELVGREKSELIGKHQRILHPPEKTEEEFSTTFKQHLKEKEGQILETRIITKNGEIKDVAVKANVFELRGKRVVQGIFRDITEHAGVSSFPERNPNPTLEVDLDGNTHYLNPAAQKIRSQLRGLKLSNAFEKELETLVDEFKIHRKENFVRENVKIGDRYYQQSIYYFSEKSVLRLYMIDVTERRKAEQALKESEGKYKSLVELAPDGIVAVNAEGIVTSTNRSFLTLVGYDSEEVVGKPFMELKTSRVEDIPKFQEMFSSLMKGESASPVEFLYVRKDGTSRWAEVHPSLLIKDGNPVGAQVIMRDVTERKNAEKLIQENQQKFEQLFMSNPEAAVHVDPNERVLNVNPHFTELFGYSFDEVKEKSLDDFVVPEDRKKEAIMLAQKGKEGRVYHETARKNKKGSLLPVAISVAPIMFQGQHLGSIVLYRDITERKQWEDALRDAKEKWSSLTENTDDIVMIVDGNGVIQYINRTIPPYTPEETVGKRVYEYVSREQHKALEKSLREASKTGKPDRFEVSSNIPKIGTIWFSTKIVPFRHDGKVTGAILISSNVTDQKKAREENEKAAKTWGITFDSISDFVFVLDKNQRFVRVNKTLCEALKKESKELIGKRCFEVLHGTNEPWPTCPFRKTLVTKKATTEEVNDPNLGIPLLVTVSPIFDDEGVFSGVVHIAKNITEQKKIEKVLRDSEERLSILFELAPDAYYLNDLKGNFVDGNKAAEEVTGYTKEELIGKSFLKLKLLPRSQALKAAKLLAMNALGKPTGPDEFVLNRKDGTQIPVEIRTYPVKIKDKNLVLGIARDITIRKKNEQAVKESQQKFEGLFKHNPEATVYLDSEFRILDASPRFCQLFGYSAKEVEGKQINEVVAPEDLMEEAERLDKDAEKGYANHDTVRKRKDGSLVHVSISAAPVSIEGKPVGYVGVYKDITNLKDAEEHLREVNMRLEVTNEKLHVIGGLTRHDVRNKLVAVTGNAYLLRQKLVGDAKALGQLNDMEAAVRLVEEIFEFARIYEKLGVEQLTSMDVGKAVDGAVSLFSGLKGVKMVNECRGLIVLADSLLSQLFYNLIDNSLKYGEKIRQIKVYCKTSGSNQLELVYEDDGVGIPDNVRSNLFKEGFTSGKGTGYGLFMIKRICEVYGWTIQEKGAQGKGARFILTVPQQRAH